MLRRAFLWSTLLLAATPETVLAQDLLTDLTTLIAGSAVVQNPSHGGAHFFNRAEPATLPVQVLAHAARQISSPTSASSSGGFLFELDPSSGLDLRKVDDFGPAFAERAQTLGRGTWSIGGTYQRLTGKGYEGRDFDRGLPFYLRHLDLPTAPPAGPAPDPFFEGDVLENVMFLEMSLDRFTLFANFGVTDRLDVGVTLPIVSVNVAAQVHTRVIRQSTAEFPTIHGLDDGGSAERIAAFKGGATGFGDLLVRAKYMAFDGEAAGAGVGVDLRLPTADSQNLLGANATQTKLYGVVSGARQRLSPHANVGFTISRGGIENIAEMPNELSYAVGAVYAASRTLTVVGDLLGRSLRGFGRYTLDLEAFPFQTVDGRQGTGIFEQYAFEPGHLHLMEGTVGFKWNPAPDILISAHVLFPLTNAGLNGGVSPVFALEYAFGR
jgi:hypothetical protein